MSTTATAITLIRTAALSAILWGAGLCASQAQTTCPADFSDVAASLSSPDLQQKTNITVDDLISHYGSLTTALAEFQAEDAVIRQAAAGLQDQSDSDFKRTIQDSKTFLDAAVDALQCRAAQPVATDDGTTPGG